MFTVYESRLNRDGGEPVITRMACREDATNFWIGGEGTEQTSYSKTSTFRNQADAEKQNEILAARGRKAALEFAKAIQNREAKTASKVTA
jgi:hypothetical protein